MVQQGTSILVIDNKDGRNEQFLPLFSAMTKAEYGKLLDKQYYIINSTMQVNQNSDATIAFSSIQNIAAIKGFAYTMYYLHEKV